MYENDIVCHLQLQKSIRNEIFQTLTHPTKTRSARAWIDIATLTGQPFLFVSNPIMLRWKVRDDHFCYNTLGKYISQLVKVVGHSILKALPGPFAIVVDDWMVGSI